MYALDFKKLPGGTMKRVRPMALVVAIGSTVCIYTPPAAALDYSWEIDDRIVDVTLEVTASYSGSWRLDDLDESILNPNNDDGDRNFRKSGTMTSSLAKLVYDFGMRTDVGSDSSIGFFNRGFGIYDSKIWDASTDHNSPFTNNGNPFYGGSLSPLNSFTQETQDRAGRDFKMLDVYAYYNMNQTSVHAATLRVGSQVINWGESLFIQSGITNAINPADVTQANLPGTEVKEILLPQASVFASVGLTNNVNLEAYYQWDWQHTIAPPAGPFLSTNDFIAEDGGETLLLPAPPSPPGIILAGTFYTRGKNLGPKKGGQYGAALRWYAEALNDTEFGFYYVNYHSKLPSLAIAGTPAAVAIIPPSPQPFVIPPAVPPGSYHIEYFKDITLLGASFNTVLWDIAFSGEVAFHDDVPLQTIAIGGPAIGMAAALGGAPLSLSTPEELIVAQLTLNKTFNTTPGISRLADDVGLLLEVGWVNTPGLRDGEVFRGPNPVNKNAWGYKSRLTLTYFNLIGKLIPVFSGTDLIAAILWDHDVNGNSAIPAGSFTDNQKKAGVSLTASWQNTFDVEFRYNNFSGAGGLTDRDNVSITFKYRF
jgi:hypothetical protein